MPIKHKWYKNDIKGQGTFPVFLQYSTCLVFVCGCICCCCSSATVELGQVLIGVMAYGRKLFSVWQLWQTGLCSTCRRWIGRFTGGQRCNGNLILLCSLFFSCSVAPPNQTVMGSPGWARWQQSRTGLALLRLNFFNCCRKTILCCVFVKEAADVCFSPHVWGGGRTPWTWKLPELTRGRWVTVVCREEEAILVKSIC